MAEHIVPAAAYYRMSDDRQEYSVADQRREVTAYAAAHGYRIVREYVDEGISGDATEKRAAFQQMLADVKSKRDFEVVLCWDQDRFGRFDPLEAGYWIKPLRDAGVRLETVAQGKIDWNDFAGRIIYAVQQEGKHAYLRDLSRNVIRGMMRVAEEGLWNGGIPPYGYAVQDRRLVPGDPDKVAVVQWLFRSYAWAGMGLSALAYDLNRRGVPSPGGKLWNGPAVEKILRRPHYLGDLPWNRQHTGQYHGLEDGAIKAKRKRKRIEKNKPAHWIVRHGTHEPLIDRETWDAVQRRLSAAGAACKPKWKKFHYVLTGLAFCGQCGKLMVGNSKQRWGKVYRKLLCSTYHAAGPSACRGGCMHERPLVTAVVRRLQADFLNPANIEALRKELRRQVESVALGDPAEARRLRAHIDELDRKINQGSERLLEEEDAALVPVLRAKLQEWQRKRGELQDRLDGLEKNRLRVTNVEAQVEAAVAELWTLHERLDDARPEQLREVLGQLVSKVELWFEQVPYGKAGRMQGVFSRGLVTIRPDLTVIRDDTMGGPITNPAGEMT
jgi:site-specific DNA recombinase